MRNQPTCFKVATAGGFLIHYKERRHYDVHPDSRMATEFSSFAEADEHARMAINLLFGRVNQYWDVVVSVSKMHTAAQIYQSEIIQGKIERGELQPQTQPSSCIPL
jgi:hypothetical protein